jgi:hypothetical protein
MRHTWMGILGLVGCSSGSDGNGITPPPPAPAAVATVNISPGPTLNLLAGASVQLVAGLRDAQGNTLTGRAIVWTATPSTVATVAGGTVVAVSAGVAQIEASSEGRSAQVSLTVTANPWSTTGSLATGRTLHSATLLSNGKVLVVGGQRVGAPFETFTSAELYDPATGTWSATGNITTARANHVAFRLQNGKVLIVGGTNNESRTRLRSAELYDPVSGTWSVTDSMRVARDIPSGTLLSDGRVLVAGGSGTGTNLDALESAELFDPATGRWTSSASMQVARGAHSFTLLAGDRVLAAGGSAGTFTVPQLHRTSEVFSVANNAWTTTGLFVTARGFHKAVALPSGRVLIAGGSDFVSTVFAAADLFDPATGMWTATGAMNIARISHTLTLLQNGRVFVAGGGGTGTPLRSAELYDPATGAWTPVPDASIGRSNHAAVLLQNGKVLVIGGQGTGAPTSVEIFDPGA